MSYPEAKEREDTAFLVGVRFGREDERCKLVSDMATQARLMSYPTSTDPEHWAIWIESFAKEMRA